MTCTQLYSLPHLHTSALYKCGVLQNTSAYPGNWKWLQLLEWCSCCSWCFLLPQCSRLKPTLAFHMPSRHLHLLLELKQVWSRIYHLQLTEVSSSNVHVYLHLIPFFFFLNVGCDDTCSACCLCVYDPKPSCKECCDPKLKPWVIYAAWT